MTSQRGKRQTDDSLTRKPLLRVLNYAFAIAVTVGGTIGVGILRAPALVAAQVDNPQLIVGRWLLLFDHLFLGRRVDGHAAATRGLLRLLENGFRQWRRLRLGVGELADAMCQSSVLVSFYGGVLCRTLALWNCRHQGNRRPVNIRVRPASPASNRNSGPPAGGGW